ncbi:MAG: hypothetical protein E7652_03215 [Ruminococcaceae bacterium]|nr:hypothetical protein [Oscillospiraceae bacterium]
MKKFIRLLCLMLAVIMLFASCGADSTSSDEPKETEIKKKTLNTTKNPEAEPEAEDEKGDEKAEATEKVEEDEDENEDEKPDTPDVLDSPDAGDKELFIEELNARYNATEPGGYSIHDSDGRKICVDSKGYITFKFEKDEQVLTEVYNDVVLSRYDDVYRVRSAKDGSILFSEDDYEGAQFVFADGWNGEYEIFNDGYIVAIEYIESFTSNATYKVGVLDATTGEWIQELSEGNPIIPLYGSDFTVDKYHEENQYIGNGCILLDVYDDVSDRRLYNINTNTVSVVNDAWEFSWTSVDFADNGTFTSYDSWSDTYFIAKNDGTLEEIDAASTEASYDRYGGYYYDAEKNNFYSMASNKDKSLCVVAQNGTLIKEQTGVTVDQHNGFFSDGTAQLVFKNKEGSYYYTKIDLFGEYLFDPIKITCEGVLDLNGNSIYCGDYNNTYKVCDDEGNIVFEMEDCDSMSVKNGVLKYRVDYTDYYVEVSSLTK